MLRTLAVSALAIGLLISCRGDEASTVEQELPAPPPKVEPPKVEPPKVEPPKVEPPTPEPGPPTLEAMVEELGVTWDFAKHEGEVQLLCDHVELGWRGQIEERSPCTTVVDTMHVVDGKGNAPWKVAGVRRSALFLTRPQGAVPEPSTPALALLDAPSKNARLSAISTSRPMKRPKSVMRAVAEAIAGPGHSEHVEALSVRPRFEIHGVFGGGADTLVVFEIEESEEWLELQYYEPMIAFAGDRIVGVVGEAIGWSGHKLAGVTDLDGDGVWEVLWWGTTDDGFGLQLTWFGSGQFQRNSLFKCACAGAFGDVYPVLRDR